MQLFFVLFGLVFAECYLSSLLSQFEPQLLRLSLYLDKLLSEFLCFLLHLAICFINDLAVLINNLQTLCLQLCIQVFQMLDLLKFLVVLELVKNLELVL